MLADHATSVGSALTFATLNDTEAGFKLALLLMSTRGSSCGGKQASPKYGSTTGREHWRDFEKSHSHSVTDLRSSCVARAHGGAAGHVSRSHCWELLRNDVGEAGRTGRIVKVHTAVSRCSSYQENPTSVCDSVPALDDTGIRDDQALKEVRRPGEGTLLPQSLPLIPFLPARGYPWAAHAM